MMTRFLILAAIILQVGLALTVTDEVRGAADVEAIKPNWFDVEWEVQREESPATLWMCDWSPDGSLVAAVYFDRHVNIYNATTGELEHGMTIPEIDTRCDGYVPDDIEYPMRYLAFSPDSMHLAVSGDDRLVRIFSRNGWNEEKRMSGHLGAVLCVDWSPNGTWLVTGSGREKVNGTGAHENVAKVWNVDTGECIRTLEDQKGGSIISARFSPSGERLAVNSDDSSICIYDTRNLSLETRLEGHTSGVLDCDWTGDEKRLVSGSRDYTARMWDIRNGTNEKYEHDNCVRCVRWDRSERYFLSSGIEKTARIYDPAVSEPMVYFREGEKYDSNVMASRWSPDGKRFVSALGKSRYLIMYHMEEPVEELVIFTKTRVGIGIFTLVSIISVVLIIVRPFRRKLRMRRG